MTIGHFAKVSNITADTLRYYEKINLLRRVHRDKAGRRTFLPEDLNWIGFIKRLKDTGMPLAEIRKYADLREKGTSTLKARQQLLKKHARVLMDRMEADRNNLQKLKEKIAFYRRELTRRKTS